MNTQNTFRNLRNILAELYDDEASARVVADDARLNVSNIKFSSKANVNWHAILREAVKANQVTELLDTVLSQYSNNQQLRAASEDFRRTWLQLVAQRKQSEILDDNEISFGNSQTKRVFLGVIPVLTVIAIAYISVYAFEWKPASIVIPPLTKTPSYTATPLPTSPLTPTLINPTNTPIQSLPTISDGVVAVNGLIQSDPPGFVATVKSVEILPNGNMRWNFEFWNKTSDLRATRILQQNTYVVDDLGNRYALIDGFDQKLQPGVRIEEKADFETPKPGASSFTLFLKNGYVGVYFEQPTYILALNTPNSSTPQPSTVPSDITFVKVDQSIQASPSQFIAIIKSVEILPNGNMRWNFELWNKTSDLRGARIQYNTYVVDDLGNRYALVDGFDQKIEPGVRIEEKLDFEAPKPGANSFTLFLDNGYVGLYFEQPTFTLMANISPKK